MPLNIMSIIIKNNITINKVKQFLLFLICLYLDVYLGCVNDFFLLCHTFQTWLLRIQESVFIYRVSYPLNKYRSSMEKQCNMILTIYQIDQMMLILGFDNSASILLMLLMKWTTVQYTNSRTNVRCPYSSMELIYWNLNEVLIQLFINLVAVFLINWSLHYSFW